MFLFLRLVLAVGLVLARSPYDVPKAEWDALNATVGGRLATGVPFARSCFQNVGENVASGGPDCGTVQSQYASEALRASQFGAMMRTQWETCQKTNEGCLLDRSNPANESAYSPPKVCYQGSVAPYIISVKNEADVIKAFSFSRRTGVPLSIKNSGHDYAGRSMAAGTLALWTHNLKYIKYSPSFLPNGCSVAGLPAIIHGAGQDMESLYTFAEANNITFMGGSGPTVGVAGWVMGGGHSVISNTYGLGVDRVLQFRIVTPDGQYRVANLCQNPDLFWALRGGGGGTYGVVLEITSEVIPYSVPTVSLKWQLEPTADNLQHLMKVAVANSLRWAEDGWGGYIYPTLSLLANPKLNASAAAASLKPLTDFLESVGAPAEWGYYPSYLPLYSAIVKTPIPAGINGSGASRLIPKTLFANATAMAILSGALAETISRSVGQTALFMTTPFNYAAKSKASITPAWREAVWHVVSTVEWDWGADPVEAKAAYSRVSSAMNPLRAITPGGGAYLNEADVYEPQAPAAFWGQANYDRLLAVKQKYDPSSLLDCWQCVGSKGIASPIASCYIDIA